MKWRTAYVLNRAIPIICALSIIGLFTVFAQEVGFIVSSFGFVLTGMLLVWIKSVNVLYETPPPARRKVKSDE